MNAIKNMSMLMRGLLALALAAGMLPVAQAAETVEYIHTDALGSPVAVTDANGVVIERTVYEPYGAVVGGAPKDGPGYTGHVSDSASRLSYMQQRYMDPELGAFLSVDPVAAHGQPVVSFHRYRYGNSSPYGFIDPDGRSSVNYFYGGEAFGTGADPLYDSAERFNLPGMTTVMGHSWSTGFRDDRDFKPGTPMLYSDMRDDIANARAKAGESGYIFLGGCNLGVQSVPARLAKDFNTSVISSAWFVRRGESSNGDITYTANTKLDGSGGSRWFHVTGPDGRSTGRIGSITMHANGKATFKAAEAPLGSKIKPSVKLEFKEGDL
ncbi:RHS repeat-associated core domain-containing protein [Stenotrophomonas sp.]|uniref:RHS repeat domain-containing protein n=1 Tax=Stenotrophomonas sp. TaxID=69392 RepID=UPI0028ADC626|nr:RHS repeat-associated core domain-containing protein [Stenotrophomonas sp.]